MPYVDQEARDRLAEYENTPLPKTAGELNYIITRIVDRTIAEGASYEDFNRIMGVLTCIPHEVYRRLVTPYENVKMAANGDVFRERDLCQYVRPIELGDA